MMVSCHAILETGRAPSRDEAKAALRKMARRYHPDVLRGLRYYREEKMKIINLAYEALRSGKDVVEVDDAWWDLLSRLELAREAFTRADWLRRKMGIPPASLKENALLAERIMERTSAFLEVGTSLSEGALAAYDVDIAAIERNLTNWTKQRDARMLALRSEAEGILREAARSGAEAQNIASDADLERGMAALRGAISSGNEDLLQEQVRKGRIALMRAKEKYEKECRIRQARLLAQERLLRTMQELMDNGFINGESFSGLCQKLDLAFAEAAEDGQPSGEELARRTLQDILAMPEIGSKMETKKLEALDRLMKCERFLGKLTGGRGFGAWANLLVWLRSACEEDDALTMIRAAQCTYELHSILMRNERELSECEESAHHLHEMLEIGYIEGEMQTLASMRAEMVIEAGKGDLGRSYHAARKIVDLDERHGKGFEEFKRERERLRGACDIIAGKAGSVAEVRKVRLQEAIASFHAAFASGELRQAEASLHMAEDLLKDVRARDLASLREEARMLADIARSRMTASECTCCWASPIERRKANALMDVMGRLENNEAMLEMAIIDMRVFIVEHDSQHDGSRERLREAYEVLLESGLVIEAAAQGSGEGGASRLMDEREAMLRNLAQGEIDKAHVERMRALVNGLRQDLNLAGWSAHQH